MRNFLVFIGVTLMLSIVLNYIFNDDYLYFEFYGNKFSYERILELINQQKKWQWIGYVTLPLIYLLRFLIITCVLLMGSFIAGYKVKFREVFDVTITSEYIFLVLPIIKLLWFGFILQDYTLIDLIKFSPFSLNSVFDLSESIHWLDPLMKSVSLFEVTYWLLLGYGMCKILNRPFSKAIGLVVASYGSTWVVWQVFIVFLMINLT
ncbi:MAG: hypothetical protein JXQ90_22470 [Cyclobacteriaceae bacterium]